MQPGWDQPEAAAADTATPVAWALDLGNTRLKLARVEHGVVVEHRVWPREAGDEALSWLLAQAGHRYALMAGRPDDEGFWRKPLEATGGQVYVYRPGQALPIRLAYHTPETLGIDRLAAVVRAQAIYPGHACLVVSAGTCMTIEHLSADGTYLGGSISPGLALRLRAMHVFTGRLPEVALVLPHGAIGVTTESAMQLGAIRGAAFEVAGWWKGFVEGHGDARSASTSEGLSGLGLTAESVRLLVCGGDAALLQPLLPEGAEHHPHLVLEGLAQLHSYALRS